MFYHLITEFVCFFSKLDNTAHEQTIICWTRVGISANEKEEKFATNENNNYWMDVRKYYLEMCNIVESLFTA